MNRIDLTKASVASFALALSALLTACGVGEANTGSAAEVPRAAPLPVEVAMPREAEILATYYTTGNLSSEADAEVVARVRGEVIEILVEEGDVVTAGQVLARLDGQRLRLAMNEIKAHLDMLEREYERNVNLNKRGLVSEAAVDDMSFELDAQRARYMLSRLNYGYTEIRSPIDGVVAERRVKVGQHLDVRDAAFRITNTSTLVSYLRIPQTELAKIAPGQEIRVSIDSRPKESFAAVVERISPTIDQENGTFRATAIIDNVQGALAPGMFARFEIAYDRHEHALTIPGSAILDDGDESFVYVVHDGEAERRVIRTGFRQNGVVEVLDGISPGEQVVVAGHGGLQNGTPVMASAQVVSTG